MKYILVMDGVKNEKHDTPKKIRRLINSMPSGTIVLVIDGCLYIIGGKENATV